MNDPTPDVLGQRIDAALGRLPLWDPPADFSTRLAAAAARQHRQPATPPPLVDAGHLLRLLSDSALVVLASLAAAGILAWGIPWSSLVQSTALVGWVSVAILLVAGAWATWRTLPAS
jgi:hypothetical protein